MIARPRTPAAGPGPAGTCGPRPVTLVLLALLLLHAGPALGHKVNIFAYVEGGTVFTESYFPDGKAVVGGTIEVLDGGGSKLLEGTTDAQGLFSFPLPAKADLTIVINAGMGHRSSYLLRASEMEP